MISAAAAGEHPVNLAHQQVNTNGKSQEVGDLVTLEDSCNVMFTRSTYDSLTLCQSDRILAFSITVKLHI